MTYQLKIEQKPGYLHAVVTGQNSMENVGAYLGELRGECIARGCFRVLIEERLAGPRLNTLDVFEIIFKGSKQTLGLYTAIAYVDLNAEGEQWISRGQPR